MDIQDYFAEAYRAYESNPDWRFGQALCNTLGSYRTDLVKILPDEIDCFYSEDRVAGFCNWLGEVW